MDRTELRALAEGPRSMRPVYPEWSDVLALLDRLEAAEARLREFVEHPPPFGSYKRWCERGDATDALAMDRWDQRVVSARAFLGESQP